MAAKAGIAGCSERFSRLLLVVFEGLGVFGEVSLGVSYGGFRGWLHKLGPRRFSRRRWNNDLRLLHWFWRRRFLRWAQRLAFLHGLCKDKFHLFLVHLEVRLASDLA